MAEPGRRGRHRIHSGPAGGVLAAGVVLLATSAAAPVVPADQAETPRATGADRAPVENRHRSWVEDVERPRSVPPRPGPTVAEAMNTQSDVDSAGPMIPVVFTGDIPSTVLDAYRRARDVINVAQPNCRLPLELLAAIGKVETGHAQRGRVDGNGTTLRPILGPVLDGNGFAAIRDTDGGRHDGDTVWDRAVGPMQFIPGTWRNWASDGNGDQRSDPHNVYDASLAAARYLCAANRDLGTPQGLDTAILSYNHSTSYRNLVIRWMQSYAASTVVVPDAGNLPVLPADIPVHPTGTPALAAALPPSTVPPSSSVPPPGSTTPEPPSTTPAPPPTTTPPGTTPPPTSGPPTSAPPSSEVPPAGEVAPPSSTPTTPPSSQPSSPPSTPSQPAEQTGLVEGVVCGVTGLLGPVLPLCP